MNKSLFILKIYLPIIMFGTFNSSYASSFHINPSEVSAISGVSILLSPVIIPLAILDSLSSNKHTTHNNYITNNNNYNSIEPTMVINKVNYPGNGNAQLETTVIKENKETVSVNFEIPESSAKNTQLHPGSKIIVEKKSVGYILQSNSKVIGIVPTEKGSEYFKQQKQ